MERKVTPVNPSDKDWCHHSYLLWFGSGTSTYLLAYANSLEAALETCADWIEENAPGLFCDDVVREEYERAIKVGELSEEQAMEQAEVDTTPVDGGHYIASEEWGIVAEDPAPREVSNFHHNR